jgi:Beta-galactosidase/beta-glucuronidase
MTKLYATGLSLTIICLFTLQACKTSKVRTTSNFCKEWRFHLGDAAQAQEMTFDDSQWRQLNLPHDWSVEGEFNEKNPATTGGGALPGGIGWYRKTFTMPESEKGKSVFIDFDGIYKNGEVWINGHRLGLRPYGYSSFRFELTPYLNYGNSKNVIAVKVDNSKQPNSRWYSGSGIYRNVWLVVTDKVFVDHWGTCITTPEVTDKQSKVLVKTRIRNNSKADQLISLKTIIYNPGGKEVASTSSEGKVLKDSTLELAQNVEIAEPKLWSVENPNLYKAETKVMLNGKVADTYETNFGIRSFEFNRDKGFLLNGKHLKINGVCDHHDLGCLGAAINTRALERQLEILKAMGCNGIRTSHNPPAPELLDLCDKMGFIVMDEAFDMWKKQKNPFDYHLDWDAWHKRDLEDMILRDRNHPSIFIWSIGNEIPEQWDSTGVVIAKELTDIVKNLDKTRPITSALNDPQPHNNIIKSGALDLIGYNYHHQIFPDFLKTYPGQKFIATETVSGFATRGSYDMPSDSIRRWPIAWDKPFTTGNADYSCSAYDNVSAPWGSTQEETWKVMKKYDFLSGQFIWTGFDYIGEPTPYPWPAKSSYFGIIDLAGFPKDVYYMYQSEWTNKDVLHIFPHWNLEKGKTVDVWAYYNNADEVELFLNGKSLGVKKKSGDDLHVSWRIAYEPGTLKAISRKNGKEVLSREIKTAGKAAKLVLSADRSSIKADGTDLSFVTVKVTDAEGNVVPNAENLVNFKVSGNAAIVGVDNGSPISHEPFKANYRKAFNGLCLAVLQSGEKPGKVTLTATSKGLEQASVDIELK